MGRLPASELAYSADLIGGYDYVTPLHPHTIFERASDVFLSAQAGLGIVFPRIHQVNSSFIAAIVAADVGEWSQRFQYDSDPVQFLMAGVKDVAGHLLTP